VEMENARRDILKIMNTPSQQSNTQKKDEEYVTA
jgi:hypothetical protein